MMRKLVWIVFLLGLTGCGSINVRHASRGFVPRIPAPARPQLETLTVAEQAEVTEKLSAEAQRKITENFGKMHLHVTQLELGIKTYNEYAEQNNALVREELGMPTVNVNGGNELKVEEKK